MSRDDIRKLLGGFATGTLTLAEQQALFEAALDDQELFDELAREQAVKEALADPAARAYLLAALDEHPAPWWRAWRRSAAVAAAFAGLVLAATLALRPRPHAVEVAMAPAPAKPPAPEATAPELGARLSSHPPAATAPDRRGVKSARTETARPAAPRLPEPEAVPTQVAPAGDLKLPVEAVPPPPPAKAETRPPQPEAVAHFRQDAAEPRGVVGGVIGGVVGGVPAGLPGGGGGGALAPQSGAPQAPARALYYAPAGYAPEPRARVAPGVLRGNGAAQPAGHLGVRYSLRTSPEGQALEIVPNRSGYVSVFAGPRPIAARFVEASQSFLVPAVPAQQQEFTVVVSREPAGSPVSPTVNLLQSVPGENATYVVTSAPGSQTLVFTVPPKQP